MRRSNAGGDSGDSRNSNMPINAPQGLHRLVCRMMVRLWKDTAACMHSSLCSLLVGSWRLRAFSQALIHDPPNMHLWPVQCLLNNTLHPLLLLRQSTCQCFSVSYPTSQSNSKCSCPSIHSSMSSLLCRSLRLYFTVSFPSLRCAGSSVLSAAWNITLDWVLGSDAMAATASGVPWRHTELYHPRTHTQTHRLTPLLKLLIEGGLLSTRISCYLFVSPSLKCRLCFPAFSSSSLPPSKAHSLALLPSSFCNTHWLQYQENGNEIWLCVCAWALFRVCVCLLVFMLHPMAGGRA